MMNLTVGLLVLVLLWWWVRFTWHTRNAARHAQDGFVTRLVWLDERQTVAAEVRVCRTCGRPE